MKKLHYKTCEYPSLFSLYLKSLCDETTQLPSYLKSLTQAMGPSITVSPRSDLKSLNSLYFVFLWLIFRMTGSAPVPQQWVELVDLHGFVRARQYHLQSLGLILHMQEWSCMSLSTHTWTDGKAVNGVWYGISQNVVDHQNKQVSYGPRVSPCSAPADA